MNQNYFEGLAGKSVENDNRFNNILNDKYSSKGSVNKNDIGLKKNSC